MTITTAELKNNFYDAINSLELAAKEKILHYLKNLKKDINPLDIVNFIMEHFPSLKVESIFSLANNTKNGWNFTDKYSENIFKRIVLNQTESFELNFDDSSSEEEYDDKINSYTILDKFTNFKEAIEKKSYFHQYALSFVTHALGIKLLYSKPVQQRYYELKQEFLSYKSEDLPNLEKINEWVRLCFKKVLCNTYFKLSENNEKTSELIWKDFETRYSTEIEKTINDITTNKRKFFKQLGKKKLSCILDVPIKNFTSTVKNYFKVLPKNLNFNFAEAKGFIPIERENPILQDTMSKYILQRDPYFKKLVDKVLTLTTATPTKKISFATNKDITKNYLEKAQESSNIEKKT